MNAAKFERLRQVVPAVSRETFMRLEAFEAQFLKWAKRINLSAPSTLSDVWERHIVDSAQLVPLAPGKKHWLDLGSGGGFPGLVIAFLLPVDGRIDLVESNRKKAGFLQAMVGQFSLPARVHAERIDAVGIDVGAPEVVTARALAPLPLLLGLTERWIGKDAIGLFHKGRDYAGEIQESAHHWTLDLVKHRSKTDSHGVVLEISNLKRRV